MKEYPSHFADVKKEVEDEIASLYQDKIVFCKTKYADNLLGDYTTTWFVDHKRVAFFMTLWNELDNQWQGCWKVFNNDNSKE